MCNISEATVNGTSSYEELPVGLVIFIVVYLTIIVVFGLLANALLVMTIQHTPNLRTPPNFHLVNIGANNMILCVSLVFSLVTVSAKPGSLSNLIFLTGVQLFVVTNCSLQYLGTFASIGIYKNISMRNTTMRLSRQKGIVFRSIVCCWFLSLPNQPRLQFFVHAQQ